MVVFVRATWKVVLAIAGRRKKQKKPNGHALWVRVSTTHWISRSFTFCSHHWRIPRQRKRRSWFSFTRNEKLSIGTTHGTASTSWTNWARLFSLNPCDVERIRNFTMVFYSLRETMNLRLLKTFLISAALGRFNYFNWKVSFQYPTTDIS